MTDPEQRQHRRLKTICFETTLWAMSGWFVVVIGLIALTRNDLSVPGVIGRLVIVAILAVPTAMGTARWIAPRLRRQSRFGKSVAGIVLVHGGVLLVGVTIYIGWAELLHGKFVPRWTALPWHLSLFLIPPMFAGSFTSAMADR